MQLHSTVRMMIVGVVVGFLSSGAMANLAKLEIPAGTKAATGAPLMKDRLTSWAKLIREAKDDQTVIVARNGIVDDYQVCEKADLGYTFAEQASEALLPLLGKALDSDRLMRVKEVNLAMAMSQIPQVPMQKALDTMVSYHRNEAVRYYGWKGYVAARARIFMQGPDNMNQAMRAIQTCAKSETSVPVIGMILNMLDLNNTPNEAWGATAQSKSFEILQSNWSNWCVRVRMIDPDMATACRKGVRAVMAIVTRTEDKKQRQAALQMVVNMAWCAAKAYEEAAINQTIEGKIRLEPGAAQPTNLPASAVVRPDTQPGFLQFEVSLREYEAFKQAVKPSTVLEKRRGEREALFLGRIIELLRECEATLNALTDTQRVFLEHVLKDPKANPSDIIYVVGAEQNYGVQAWVDELKNLGVVQPKFDKPASSPSSAPAGNP